jgi:hypothetical protein
MAIPAVLLYVLGGPMLLHGGENTPIDGKMLAGERIYKLTHVVAFESKSEGGAAITVVASDRKIALEPIQAALRAGKGEQVSLSQPHLTISLDASGKPVYGNASANGTYFSFSGSALKGDLKVQDGHIRGQARLETRGEGKLKRSFDIRVDVALGFDGPPKTASKPTGPVKPSVTGTFKGNGQPANLAYVSVRRGEPFANKPTLVIVFTEKDHSGERQPEVKARFGDFGSALVITAHDDGQIIGCDVAHAAHSKKPFSSIGNVTTEAFEVGDGRVEGRISSGGEVKTFDQTWEVDIRFTAPFFETQSKRAADAVPSTKKQGVTDVRATRSASKETAPSAKDLPIPTDATNVERRTLVKQIACQSPAPVESVAGELTKKLADQGWTEHGSDLLTTRSAILRRSHGTAKLIIMVKATNKGSRVIIFTEGLDWEVPDTSK